MINRYKLIPCDVVSPSLGKDLEYLLEDHFVQAVLLLVVLLMLAALATIVIVARNKPQQPTQNPMDENKDNTEETQV